MYQYYYSNLRCCCCCGWGLGGPAAAVVVVAAVAGGVQGALVVAGAPGGWRLLFFLRLLSICKPEIPYFQFGIKLGIINALKMSNFCTVSIKKLLKQ